MWVCAELSARPRTPPPAFGRARWDLARGLGVTSPVSVDEITHRTVDYYWPQARPFHEAGPPSLCGWLRLCPHVWLVASSLVGESHGSQPRPSAGAVVPAGSPGAGGSDGMGGPPARHEGPRRALASADVRVERCHGVAGHRAVRACSLRARTVARRRDQRPHLAIRPGHACATT